MDLLAAVLIARLLDPVTAVVAFAIAALVNRWWAIPLAALAATIAAEVALGMIQPGRPLLGFALIGGFLAGAAWALGAVILRRSLHRPV